MAPYSLIIPGLYIGGKNAMYQDIKFDTIINCTTNVQCPDYCKNCIIIPVNNSKKDCNKFFNIITKTTNVLEKIHTSIKEGKKVLVHCMEGMHRSCSLVACYFMKYYNMNIKQSMAFVKSKRRIAFSPVYNVFCVIEMYYNYLHPTPKQIDKPLITEKENNNVKKNIIM